MRERPTKCGLERPTKRSHNRQFKKTSVVPTWSSTHHVRFVEHFYKSSHSTLRTTKFLCSPPDNCPANNISAYLLSQHGGLAVERMGHIRVVRSHNVFKDG